jgi:hypothetical protein
MEKGIFPPPAYAASLQAGAANGRADDGCKGQEITDLGR